MNAKIPLILKLKKESQKKIARAQDIMVDEMIKIFDKIVLHGGTAIWRCYQGNRFSEDIDVYMSKDINKINRFLENLSKRNLILEKKKIGENSFYSSLRFENVIVRFEALFKYVKGELKEYETADGNMLTVRTLLPEELIKEKINAYQKRIRIRDLYDIFFLLRNINDKSIIGNELKKFLLNFKNPVDKENLKILIISGLVPDLQEMLNYIQREVK